PRRRRCRATLERNGGFLQQRVLAPAPAVLARRIAARRRDRRPVLRPVRHEPGRAPRASVLGERTMILRLILATAGALFAAPALALNVFACEPEWGALVKELGGAD